MDLKALKGALDQLEEERNIPQDKIIEAIADSLVAAYKKDYGKKGQIVRAHFDMDSGKIEFQQIKIAVDNTTVRLAEEEPTDDLDERPRFNEEHHIWLEDAQKIKRDCQLGDELIFPLDTQEDFGRIAAQTAKQVIIQRIREAEKVSILDEYEGREGDIINGKVQKLDRGNVFIDLGRTTAILPYEEQVPGEYYRQGERIRAYLFKVEDTPRGIALKLSRSHPKFVEKLFAVEAPEIANGTVEVKAIAREAGSRTKIAVISHDQNIDAVGSCVGQKGSRVNTVITELGGEKIDIIEWSDRTETFIGSALSPAKINEVKIDEENRSATISVDPDQFSLAVGKGGQNVRLAAKLTGWRIDIVTPEGSNKDLAEVVEKVTTEETPTEPVSTEEATV
ncbi:MAG: transcription termination factor NusA [Candidatus Vogelbacteria bacterium]|nr:transcription termination factor NusA [Candidatus Vogelbacteria bacterium]